MPQQKMNLQLFGHPEIFQEHKNKFKIEPSTPLFSVLSSKLKIVTVPLILPKVGMAAMTHKSASAFKV
jgi:hypothetical protein